MSYEEQIVQDDSTYLHLGPDVICVPLFDLRVLASVSSAGFHVQPDLIWYPLHDLRAPSDFLLVGIDIETPFHAGSKL